MMGLDFSSDAHDEVVADEEKEEDGGGDGEAMPNENLCFQKIISNKSRIYVMGLLKKFVRATELEDRSAIKMTDHEGKEWIIGLLFKKFHNMLSLSSGWSFFRKHYNISEGDICLFKFIKEQGVLSLAQLLKNRRARKHQTLSIVDQLVKRKRGRMRIEKCGGGV